MTEKFEAAVDRLLDRSTEMLLEANENALPLIASISCFSAYLASLAEWLEAKEEKRPFLYVSQSEYARTLVRQILDALEYIELLDPPLEPYTELLIRVFERLLWVRPPPLGPRSTSAGIFISSCNLSHC